MARVPGPKKVHYHRDITATEFDEADLLFALLSLAASRSARASREIPPRQHANGRGSAAMTRGASSGDGSGGLGRGGGVASWRWVVVALVFVGACLSPLVTNAQEETNGRDDSKQKPGAGESGNGNGNDDNDGNDTNNDTGNDPASAFAAPTARALSSRRRPSFPLYAAAAVGGEDGTVELTWTPPLTRLLFPGGSDDDGNREENSWGEDEEHERGWMGIIIYNRVEL